jgi:hypothetical protein
MRLRQHRGSLDASLTTVMEIDATMPALVAAIRSTEAPNGAIHVSPYGFDHRCGWETHVVFIEGHGVYGFTDQMPIGTAA